MIHCSNFYSQIKNEDELKKQAEKHFEEVDYNLAYKLYAQLVSLYPKDPDYNYKLGVCMIFTEPDKKKPYSYLKIATNNPADAPKDAMPTKPAFASRPRSPKSQRSQPWRTPASMATRTGPGGRILRR